MAIRIATTMIKLARHAAPVLLAAILVACGGSLDTQDGPTSGTVSGVVCQDVSTLSAVATVPESQAAFIREGKCVNLRGARVNFVRTVTMPGEGKYSQFEYADKGTSRKLWIKTALVRGA
jgi:hypothetical protein